MQGCSLEFELRKEISDVFLLLPNAELFLSDELPLN